MRSAPGTSAFQMKAIVPVRSLIKSRPLNAACFRFLYIFETIMNKYSINDYIPRSQTNSLRLEACYSISVANRLLSEYKSKGLKTLNVAQLFKLESERLLMPDELLPLLREQVEKTSVRTIVTGINGYLSLIAPKYQKDFFYGLRTWLDERSDMNAAILFSWSNILQDIFRNPKYNNSLQLSIITESLYPETVTIPKVYLVPEKWLLTKENVLYGFKELLLQWGDFGPSTGFSNADSNSSFIISVNGDVKVQAGLRDSIVFCQTIKSLPNVYLQDLPEKEAEALINYCKEKNLIPEKYLRSLFENAHNDPVRFFKILYNELDNPLWQTIATYIRNKIAPPNCCLAQVLAEDDLTSQNFLQKYAVDIPLRRLASSLSSNSTTDNSIPEERKEALLSLPPSKRDSLVHDFINAIRDYPSDISLLKYLNLNTNWEYQEIIRRVFNLSDPSVIPAAFLESCPLLKDYLSSYNYGSEELDSYFTDYRQLRATNRITPEFVRRAFAASVPDFIESCQYKLNSLKNQDDLGLLIIDGLGAEFVPLLNTLIRSETQIGIESSCVVKAKLPTSTCFNPIEQSWPESRIVGKFQDLDNIAHQEAVKGNECSPEENFLASLRAVAGIINKVKDALQKFARVVLTADHGLSRLAVLAYENDLVETLPVEGDDWRYVCPNSDDEIPDNLKNAFDTIYDCHDNKYWVVRGYNRLKKSGGKSNELHGGATLEEQLIPFIIFSKGSESVQPPYVVKSSSSSVQTSNDQMEEEDLGI